jgi:DNA-binding HxlR family transcriptional regulator
MFVRSLRELAQDNLSDRTIYSKVPARVECALTNDGATPLLALGFMSNWWNRRS